LCDWLLAPKSLSYLSVSKPVTLTFCPMCDVHD
jgi:hypothetical protein